MPLTAGAHLGPYETLAALGAGGMGEVYRARDSRLHRNVAIKILPAAIADHPIRRTRFERERRRYRASIIPIFVRCTTSARRTESRMW